MRIFGRLVVIILAVFGPLLAYLGFIGTALALYRFGGCEGALGSGITCAKGDGFGSLALTAEMTMFGLWMIPVGWAVVSSAVVVLILLVRLISRPKAAQ